MCTYRIVQSEPDVAPLPYEVHKKKSLFWGLLTWWSVERKQLGGGEYEGVYYQVIGFRTIEDAQNYIDLACIKRVKEVPFKPLIISTTTCQTQPK